MDQLTVTVYALFEWTDMPSGDGYYELIDITGSLEEASEWGPDIDDAVGGNHFYQPYTLLI